VGGYEMLGVHSIRKVKHGCLECHNYEMCEIGRGKKTGLLRIQGECSAGCPYMKWLIGMQWLEDMPCTC